MYSVGSTAFFLANVSLIESIFYFSIYQHFMSGQARFQLYVKAGEDGTSLGDCPFSHRVAMFAQMSVKPENIEFIPVNTVNKPESFLKLNPEGKVPVLVDRENGAKVVPDSAEIVKYLNELSPNTGLCA